MISEIDIVEINVTIVLSQFIAISIFILFQELFLVSFRIFMPEGFFLEI